MSASTTPAKPDKRGCPCKHPERLGTAIVSLASFLAIFIAVYLFPVAAPLVKVSPYNNHTNTTHAPSLLVGVSSMTQKLKSGYSHTKITSRCLGLCTQRNNHEKWRCSSFSFGNGQLSIQVFRTSQYDSQTSPYFHRPYNFHFLLLFYYRYPYGPLAFLCSLPFLSPLLYLFDPRVGVPRPLKNH